jgi:hypothetical protein
MPILQAVNFLTDPSQLFIEGSDLTECRPVFEKPTVAQPLKKFLAFYGS